MITKDYFGGQMTNYFNIVQNFLFLQKICTQYKIQCDKDMYFDQGTKIKVC